MNIVSTLRAKWDALTLWVAFRDDRWVKPFVVIGLALIVFAVMVVAVAIIPDANLDGRGWLGCMGASLIALVSGTVALLMNRGD